MLLNYWPICYDSGDEFTIISGNQLYIGLLRESYPASIDGQFDVIGIPESNFYDYEEDLPISIVPNSWTMSSNWPAETNMVLSGGLLSSPDFNSTNATTGTVYQVNVTI